MELHFWVKQMEKARSNVFSNTEWKTKMARSELVKLLYISKGSCILWASLPVRFAFPFYIGGAAFYALRPTTIAAMQWQNLTSKHFHLFAWPFPTKMGDLGRIRLHFARSFAVCAIFILHHLALSRSFHLTFFLFFSLSAGCGCFSLAAAQVAFYHTVFA